MRYANEHASPGKIPNIRRGDGDDRAQKSVGAPQKPMCANAFLKLPAFIPATALLNYETRGVAHTREVKRTSVS